MLNQTVVPPVPPTKEKFLNDKAESGEIEEEGLKEKTPWYSMFAAFFAGSEYLQDFDELGEISQDHYFLLLKSLRGEKHGPAGSAATIDCPSLNTFGQDENEQHAPSDFHFRNRDTNTLNMIFVNEYEMEKDQATYALFVRKFVYEKVFFSYWIPISLAQIGLTLIIVLFIIWFINHQVLKPIQEMS